MMQSLYWESFCDFWTFRTQSKNYDHGSYDDGIALRWEGELVERLYNELSGCLSVWAVFQAR